LGVHKEEAKKRKRGPMKKTGGGNKKTALTWNMRKMLSRGGRRRGGLKVMPWWSFTKKRMTLAKKREKAI